MNVSFARAELQGLFTVDKRFGRKTPVRDNFGRAQGLKLQAPPLQAT